ncbi:MAG: GyrI-like domain-containing protein [Culicoidibacterales bacterium]
MKNVWRTTEKEVYIGGEAPAKILVKPYKYLTIMGCGDPNQPDFLAKVAALYALTYAVKMSYRKPYVLSTYTNYTVYPLEGVWDLREDARNSKTWTKADLVYKLLIRQPDFVTTTFMALLQEIVRANKPDLAIADIVFEVIEEGLCVQMLHLGPYELEANSFALMDQYCEANQLERIDLRHREIYCSDPRKTSPDKLRTTLRFKVSENKKS